MTGVGAVGGEKRQEKGERRKEGEKNKSGVSGDGKKHEVRNNDEDFKIT